MRPICSPFPPSAPDLPHLPSCPVILSFSDAFTKPCPFEPHVVVDIEDEFDRVVAMLHCHQSQFYEWLPYNAGFLEQVPRGDSARAQWLADTLRARILPLADRYRDVVIRTYGQERGQRVRLIEAFEVSEYGAPLDAKTRARLFPFLPAASSVSFPFTHKTWVDIPHRRREPCVTGMIRVVAVIAALWSARTLPGYNRPG